AKINAMKMALEEHKAPLVHNSDRGSQYICKDYIKLLNEGNMKVSMAQSAQDKAYAERINRTIKEDYLDHWKPKNFEQLKRCLTTAVDNYNNKRPHNNLGNLNPAKFEQNWNISETINRLIIKLFTNGI